MHGAPFVTLKVPQEGKEIGIGPRANPIPAHNNGGGGFAVKRLDAHDLLQCRQPTTKF